MSSLRKEQFPSLPASSGRTQPLSHRVILVNRRGVAHKSLLELVNSVLVSNDKDTQRDRIISWQFLGSLRASVFSSALSTDSRSSSCCLTYSASERYDQVRVNCALAPKSRKQKKSIDKVKLTVSNVLRVVL